MKRYSLTYFIGQSFKGLWRNGVMSTASIMVLMSCLVVMGSFALLVYNINVNLEELGVLNEIVVYADPSMSQPDQHEQILSEGVQPYSGSLPEIIASVDSQTAELDAFTDLNAAYVTAGNLFASMPTIKAAAEASGDPDLLAGYSALEEHFIEVYHRVVSIKDLETRIKALNNVSGVVFTSKTAGLEEMREKYSDYPDLFDKLRINPLTDKFTITYDDNSAITTLQFQLENLDPILYKVNCRADVAETISQVKNGVILIFSWFMAILFVVSIFVIINTIKLAVFARREEISIMRYVGATNWFITLPFVFEGIIIGLLASGLGYILQSYMFNYVYEMVLESFQMVTVVPFEAVRIYIIVGFVSIGMITGILGSSVSLHKYLKA